MFMYNLLMVCEADSHYWLECESLPTIAIISKINIKIRVTETIKNRKKQPRSQSPLPSTFKSNLNFMREKGLITRLLKNRKKNS